MVESVNGVPRAIFDKIMSGIFSAAQKKADADMAHAGAWKSAKDRELNTEALKQAVKLRKMENGKARAYLRDLALYAHVLGVTDQLELQLGDNAAAMADPVEDETDEPDEDEADLFADVGETGRGATEPAEPSALDFTAAEPQQAEEAIDGPGADWGEERLTTTEIPANAGATFNAGAAAAVAGAAAEENPHPEGSMDFRLWRDGFLSVAPAPVAGVFDATDPCADEMPDIPEFLRVAVPDQVTPAAQ